MLENELKTLLESINLWFYFKEWIIGQTVVVQEDGLFYHTHDIDSFLRQHGYFLVSGGTVQQVIEDDIYSHVASGE